MAKEEKIPATRGPSPTETHKPVMSGGRRNVKFEEARDKLLAERAMRADRVKDLMVGFVRKRNGDITGAEMAMALNASGLPSTKIGYPIARHEAGVSVEKPMRKLDDRAKRTRWRALALDWIAYLDSLKGDKVPPHSEVTAEQVYDRIVEYHKRYKNAHPRDYVPREPRVKAKAEPGADNVRAAVELCREALRASGVVTLTFTLEEGGSYKVQMRRTVTTDEEI